MIPYQVDVYMEREPLGNLTLVVFTFLVFGLQMTTLFWTEFVLQGWNPLQMISHQFLHADLWHLVGNMICLWVFGNAVCSKVGCSRYMLLYLGLGVMAAVAHLLFDGDPAVGASGAINGIIGFYLILYPLNKVSCAFFIFPIIPISFKVRGVWLILIWFCFDLWGAWAGAERIAYHAHIGGFIAGVLAALVFLHLEWITMGRADTTLIDWLTGKTRRSREQIMREHRQRVAVTQKQTTPKNKISLLCRCGRRLKVPLKLAGHKARCPSCTVVFTVPVCS